MAIIFRQKRICSLCKFNSVVALKIWIRNILVLYFFLSSLNTASAQLFNYNCKQYYLNGPNVCWKNYGWDFGDNAFGWGGGNGYDAAWWENTFTQVQNYKGNSVRIWVHCKGEHNPLFSSGTCTGLPNNFFNNLDDCLNRAKNHNLMVILCLWDFHLTDVGRQDVVKDITKSNAYINNALIPIVTRYANQCNLIGYEIFNEPEWVMSGVPGGGTFGGAPITITEMQRFVGLCAAAIHNNSDKTVTVGSASLKWNSDVSPATGNYWKNSALMTATGGNSQAFLDYYQIHYYDWMASSGNNFSPYNRPLSYWGLDKPVLIGETGNTGFYNYQQQFDLGFSNGYAGTMVWAYASGGAAMWSEFNTQMLNFRNAHPSLVDFTCGSGSCCTLPNLGPDVTLCGGVTSATLNSNAGSTSNKTYKWYRNGTLIAGATSSTYGPTSTVGEYVVEVDSLTGACVKRDTLVVQNTLIAPNLGADFNLCSPASVNLSAGSFGSTPVTYQWLKSGSPIPGATSMNLTNIRSAGTYQVNVSSSGCATVSDQITITSNLPTPVDACIPSTGSTNLAITNPGLSGTNYNWYATATGGSPLTGGTGTTTFTTPTISATTTYYVQDMSVVGGAVGPTTQFASNFGRNPTADDRFNLWFNTGAQSVTINYVTVWAWFNAANTNYYINLRLRNNSNVVQQTNSVAVMHTSTGWQQKRIPVGFTVPANVTGWKMDAAGTTMSPICDLNYASAGASYPYNSTPSTGIIIITGQGDVTWEPNGYSFFYNWEFSTGSVCARIPVVATIGSCGSLPVELQNFLVSVKENKVSLTWNTLTEYNNSRFEIERSYDGKSFKKIGTVVGVGNSSTVQEYSFIDPEFPKGSVYYRLKQIDIDSQVYYSEIQSATLETIQFGKLYPNPLQAGENLTVEVKHIQKTPIQICLKNMVGMTLYSESRELNADITRIELPTKSLEEGIYFVEIMSSEIFIREKILVLTTDHP